MTTTTTTPIAVDTTISSAQAEKVMKDLLKKAAKEYGADGIQVAVLSGEEIIHTGNYGWAQKEKYPVAADTMYRIASPTKTIVSMIVHRLVDEGKLSLDDDISDYLGVKVRHPKYPDLPVTVKMLLSHTSSFKDVDYFESLADLRKHFSKPEEAFTSAKPGTNYVYNNFAFSVLGAVCELAANSNITDMADEYFFEPMGISATFMRGRVPKEKFGILYNAGGSVGLDMKKNQGKGGYAKQPAQAMFCFAGGLFISASDYARLLAVLMNDGQYGGRQLLSADAVASIHEVQFKRGGGIQQCLPVWRKDGMYGQDILYHHTGSAYGVYSLYAYNPENDTAVVVITSGANGVRDENNVYAICGDIIGAIYEQSELFFNKTLV